MDKPGSPPQVRGKRGYRLRFLCGRRITPAGAGKTYLGKNCVDRNRDHPRRCGENCAPVMLERCPSGSPPQVRGKQCSRSALSAVTGITPAGAGKTGLSEGERQASTGSPPQVRGKLIHIPPSSQVKRITPAGAGKTAPCGNVRNHGEDHPRRCGENSVHQSV